MVVVLERVQGGCAILGDYEFDESFGDDEGAGGRELVEGIEKRGKWGLHE